MVEELKRRGQCTSLFRWQGPRPSMNTTSSRTRRMLRKARLLIAALGFGWYLVIAGGLPASAEPRVVAEGDGTTVYERAVERADRGTGILLIARLDPKRMAMSVVEGNEAPPASVLWSVTINGSYFSEAGTPVYHLREGSRVFAPFGKGTNAVSGAGRGGVRSSIPASLPLTSPMISLCNRAASSGGREAN